MVDPSATEAAEKMFQVRIARGSIYLDRALCDLHFSDIEAIAALHRDGVVLLLPLHGAAAGGMLLKRLNAQGDRVVHASEFLRLLGIESDAPERWVPVRWDDIYAGLVLQEIGSSTAVDV